MQIATLKIKNFRGIREGFIRFSPYAAAKLNRRKLSFRNAPRPSHRLVIP